MERPGGSPILDDVQRAEVLRLSIARLLRVERYGELCGHDLPSDEERRNLFRGLRVWGVFAWTTTALIGRPLSPSPIGWLLVGLAAVVIVAIVFRISLIQPWIMAIVFGAWPASAIALALAGESAQSLIWWYAAPLLLALIPWVLSGLRLATARDFSYSVTAVVRSAPLLGPVALVVLFIPLFTPELWQAASDLQLLDGVSLTAATVGLMAALLWSALRSSTEKVVDARARALQASADPLSLVVAEVRRIDGEKSAATVEQLGRDFAREAFRAPVPQEYAPYIAATVRRSLDRQLVARLLPTISGAVLLLSFYFYVLEALILERARVQSWTGSGVPFERIDFLGLELVLPGGVYLQAAALLGVVATAVYLSFVLTEDRYSEAVADALLHRPIDRCLVLSVPYVWLDEQQIAAAEADPSPAEDDAD